MKNSHIVICASVLSADFSNLGDQVVAMENAGIDRLHIDVMDGHFVPNFSMGPKVVAAINRSTNLFLSVHLMIYNPFEYVESFVEAGADQITFHFEATEDIEDTLQFIKKCGVRAGLAIRPETPVSFLPRFFPLLDEILIMTVNPGFGGQKLIPKTLEKIREARHYVDTIQGPPAALPIDIAVDGGINEITTASCAEAGANVIVSGSYLFGANDMAQNVAILRKEATDHFDRS
jgi:ribulose-phosphate 3-epimerase